jgi:cysteine-rich repeat protein
MKTSAAIALLVLLRPACLVYVPESDDASAGESGSSTGTAGSTGVVEPTSTTTEESPESDEVAGESASTASVDDTSTTSTDVTNTATATTTTTTGSTTTTTTVDQESTGSGLLNALCGDGKFDPEELCDDTGIDCRAAESQEEFDSCVRHSRCYIPCSWKQGKVECNDFMPCMPAACGDNQINSPKEVMEECDDGKILVGDGCSQDCTQEEDVFVIFVTNEKFAPKFSSAGADQRCQTAAEVAGLANKGEVFKAWLSDVEWISVGKFMFPNYHNAWIKLPILPSLRRRDGELIASNAHDLILKGGPLLPINVNENGDLIPGFAWTGTRTDGTGSEKDCTRWAEAESDSITATIGSLSAVDGKWTDDGTIGCNQAHHLYCFRAQ